MLKIETICAAAALALLASWGGGGGPPPRTITNDDIQAMMKPGDATGMLFSGTYVVTNSTIDACQCRSGTCLQFHPRTGSVSMFVEQDGTLTLDNNCTGGVDADGKFWCGGQQPEPGGGVTLAVATGTFLLGGAAPTGLEMTEELTIAATIGATNFDCDLRGHAVAAIARP
jgi:hypothetical protein